ncbi:MAG: 4'-phosphopantetheinyl transferase superfamily protein [Myxococcales bacterium]|nr:4'-phosphopantetheinyl transferase superfamily protein [Myxococcales bacterium]
MRPVVIHRLRVADALSWSGSLTAEEEARAGRFRFEVDRDRFRAGRGALRHWVGGALGIAPAAVVFLEGTHGKPFVEGAPVFFNLSHSGDWIVLALADAEVGVDVELAREDVDVLEIAKVVFTSRELEELDALEPGGEQRRAFYRLWARKEAVLKAWGTGFSLDAKRVHVGLAPAPLEVSLAGLDAVSVEDVAIDARHAGAVAVVI